MNVKETNLSIMTKIKMLFIPFSPKSLLTLEGCSIWRACNLGEKTTEVENGQFPAKDHPARTLECGWDQVVRKIFSHFRFCSYEFLSKKYHL